jgi:hypothetical protein
MPWVLGWANDSISERTDLLQKAKALGLDNDTVEAEQALKVDRHKLEAYQQRRGVKRLRKFGAPREIATRFARHDDYWTYCFSHQFVHGSDIAWSYARRLIGADVAGLHAKTNDPRTRASFAEFAASSVTVAAAACTMFDWLKVSSLDEPLTVIRALLSPAHSSSAKGPMSQS